MNQQSDTIGKLATALAQAQGAMPNAPKEGNSHHGRYATLGSVIRVLGLVLPKYGLSFVQTFQEPERSGFVAVRTTLLHESGEWMAGVLELPVGGKKDAQGYGSSMTYAKRYSLAALVGIITDDDDDGAAASMQKAAEQEKRAVKKAAEVKRREEMRWEANGPRHKAFFAKLGKYKLNYNLLAKWCENNGDARCRPSSMDDFELRMLFTYLDRPGVTEQFKGAS